MPAAVLRVTAPPLAPWQRRLRRLQCAIHSTDLLPMTPSFVRVALGVAGLASLASAQLQTVLWTGRFPCRSADFVNERPDGAITRIEEFDFAYATPLPGTAARSLLPSTALQCYLGDANGDGNYLKFHAWKTYFQQINLGGIFVKAADRSAVTWDKIYFTVRRNAAATAGNSPGALQLEVFTNNGTQVQTLLPGDWLRLLPNGNVEFFMTQAQFAVAVGPQGGAATVGAGALLQADNGDLYYSPVDGSHTCNGNQTPQVAFDGAICKIDAANITYDANGNVAAFAPSSARVLINETPASSVPNTRDMTGNSGLVDRLGGALLAPAYGFGKIVGLAFDPNGGTFVPPLAGVGGVQNPEPNLLFTTDAGGWGGGVISTAINPVNLQPGVVAVINGVQMGSTTLGVPSDGSYIGVAAVPGDFQPTYMGFQLVDFIAETPFVLDVATPRQVPTDTPYNFGFVRTNATQPTLDFDLHGLPLMPFALLLADSPSPPGGFAFSLPASLLPLPLTPDTYDDLFTLLNLQVLAVGFTDLNGYATITLANPNTGGFTGATALFQALGLQANGWQLSTPVLLQAQ